MEAERPPIVLLVEDNDAIRENLVELLDMEGFGCWVACDADEALRRLDSEGRRPDVVLLDLLMPGLPVPDFVAHVRRRAAWAATPIVLMTALCESDVPTDLDVDAVVMKPFRAEALLDMVRAAAEGRALSSLPRERDEAK
jgi:serine/threonine-protein kinase PpkA